MGGFQRPPVPSAQAHKRTCICSEVRPWLGTLPAGAPGSASWEAGCKAGAIIYGGPGHGAHGRQHPAEEVIRMLPGAGSKEGVGGSGSLSRVKNSRSVGGGGEPYTQEWRWESQRRGGAGVGAVFLGLPVCQSGLGRCRGACWLERGMWSVQGGGLAKALPSSPAWGSSICPHKTSLPGLMFLLEAQTANGGIRTAPQSPAGPSFLPQPSCEALLRVGVGFQSPGSFIAFLRQRSLTVLGSCVPDSSQNTL